MVAKLDAMVVNLDVKSEKVRLFDVKSRIYYPEKSDFFDENLKLCNEKIKEFYPKSDIRIE